jgi:hypothetical protein
VYQQDRPERWAAKHSVFYDLANSLAKMGHEVYFYCNRASVKSRYMDGKFIYDFEDKVALRDVLTSRKISCVVIWGGRTDADDKVRSECQDSVKLVYAEAGWFPQEGHCYFSPFGTNANARFNKEGLLDHELNVRAFNRARRRVLFSSVGLKFLVAPDFAGIKKFDTGKPIFVPLQDEGDTNIILSSPVRTMTDFISTLVMRYPDVKFVVRPHPRASYDRLPAHSSVTYQSSDTSPFKEFNQYGGVIGINSTMLLQYALLGLPVAGVGEGVATGSGAYFDLNYKKMPACLEDISYQSAESAKFFDFLLNVKQLRTKGLRDISYVIKSYLNDIFRGKD